MESDLLLQALEETAEKVGIQVRYEVLDDPETPVRDGLCRIKGRRVLFVHGGRTVRERIHILLDTLKTVDLSGVYVKPVVRRLLEEEEDSEPDPGIWGGDRR